MADTGSDVLNMLNATPQERAALAKIAMLRAQGISDQEIFAGLADPSFTQGGGYGYIDPVLQAAGITSSYNLGRGNLALNAADAAYQRQGNPYNVVTALQQMRDTGSSAVLGDPMLSNVNQGPASIYESYLQSLFDSSTFPQTQAATGSVGNAGTQMPSSRQSTNPTGQSWIDAWRAYHPGQPDPVPGYGGGSSAGQQSNVHDVGWAQQQMPGQYRYRPDIGSTANPGPTNDFPTSAYHGFGPGTGGGSQPTGGQTAQQGAARLLGSSLDGVGLNTPQFRSTLAGGGVPGLNTINEHDAGLLSPDQMQSYLGLIASTGRVSNPAQAYNHYLGLYRQN